MIYIRHKRGHSGSSDRYFGVGTWYHALSDYRLALQSTDKDTFDVGDQVFPLYLRSRVAVNAYAQEAWSY
jgi:hypothetical protein